jgi:UDP-N-acetyl-D-mannosaminuronate dehydrogenase
LVALEDALSSAGFIVLLVDHAPFRAINPSDLADKRLYDTRGIWTGSATESTFGCQALAAGFGNGK